MYRPITKYDKLSDRPGYYKKGTSHYVREIGSAAGLCVFAPLCYPHFLSLSLLSRLSFSLSFCYPPSPFPFFPLALLSSFPLPPTPFSLFYPLFSLSLLYIPCLFLRLSLLYTSVSLSTYPTIYLPVTPPSLHPIPPAPQFTRFNLNSNLWHCPAWRPGPF